MAHSSGENVQLGEEPGENVTVYSTLTPAMLALMNAGPATAPDAKLSPIDDTPDASVVAYAMPPWFMPEIDQPVGMPPPPPAASVH